jgi:hypothetical protein
MEVRSYCIYSLVLRYVVLTTLGCASFVDIDSLDFARDSSNLAHYYSSSLASPTIRAKSPFTFSHLWSALKSSAPKWGVNDALRCVRVFIRIVIC